MMNGVRDRRSSAGCDSRLQHDVCQERVEFFQHIAVHDRPNDRLLLYRMKNQLVRRRGNC